MDLWFCGEWTTDFPQVSTPQSPTYSAFSFYSALQPHQVLPCFLTNRFTEGEASKSLAAWMHRLCTKLILNLYNNSISVWLRKHKHHRTCSPADHHRSVMTLSRSLRCFCRGFMIYMEPLEAVRLCPWGLCNILQWSGWNISALWGLWSTLSMLKYWFICWLRL